MKSLTFLVPGLLALTTVAHAQPTLSIQGKPYFGGSLTLAVSAEHSVGSLVWLGLGIDPLPLDMPIATAKGPYYIGTLLQALPLGAVPGSGVLSIPVVMPASDPLISGIQIVAQSFTDGRLSNPAVVTLDEPYLLTSEATTFASPTPSIGAQFGYRIAAGDFNGDGSEDLAVSAAYEDLGAFDQAGAVYVLWGPSHQAFTRLTPPDPREWGLFGISLTVADVDADTISDLVVGETAGSPTPPDAHAYLHVFIGGPSFPGPGSVAIPSHGTGAEYSGYTHSVAAGDFDGDGAIDLAVSHNKAPVAGLQETGIIDYLWGPLFDTLSEVESPDPEALHGFGSRLMAADMNGDGVMDIVEVSTGDDIDGVSAIGSAHVVWGPGLDVSAIINCPLPLGPKTLFGMWLSVADMNSDQVLDLVISDLKDRVFILFGPSFRSSVTIAKPPGTTTNPFGETAYGSTHLAFDVNADGLVDVVIADLYEGDLTGCGAFSSGGTLLIALAPYFSTFHRIHDVTQECGAQFGHSLFLRDINTDGVYDLLVGSIGADDGQVINSGHVTRFSGTNQ